jgi:hypothetical protein
MDQLPSFKLRQRRPHKIVRSDTGTGIAVPQILLARMKDSLHERMEPNIVMPTTGNDLSKWPELARQLRILFEFHWTRSCGTAICGDLQQIRLFVLSQRNCASQALGLLSASMGQFERSIHQM